MWPFRRRSKPTFISNNIELRCITTDDSLTSCCSSKVFSRSTHQPTRKRLTDLFSIFTHRSFSGIRKRKKPSGDKYHKAQLKARIAVYESGSLLDLSQQHLTDLDMVWIVEQVVLNKQCTQLDLSSNLITAQGAQVIANSISSSHLQTLDVGFNHLADSGVQSLVQSLLIPNNNNIMLTDLRLSNNSITDEGASYLAQMLESTSNNVTHLWLSYNEITARGVQLLATAISGDKSKLELLALVENPFGDDCVNAIVDMLERSLSLISLDVSKTNLSLMSKSRLKKVARRKSLFKLSVSGNAVEKVLMRIL